MSLRLRVEPPGTAPFAHESQAASVVVGRSTQADLVVADSYLSRRHARLYLEPDGWYVEDLGSKNPTRVNGRPVAAPERLRPGDVIELASTRLVFEPAENAPPGLRIDSTVFRPASEILGLGEADLTARRATVEGLAGRLRLLNEVHRFIEERGLRFALLGSSARKLKAAGTNLLAGRALRKQMFPLTPQELGADFDLETVLRFGSLPLAWRSSDRRATLLAYVQTYLREEIRAESIVRNLPGFARFLPVAALFHGQGITVVSKHDPRLPSRDVVDGQVRGVVAVAAKEHMGSTVRDAGEECVDRHPFPCRIELRPFCDTVDVSGDLFPGKGVELFPSPCPFGAIEVSETEAPILLERKSRGGPCRQDREVVGRVLAGWDSIGWNVASSPAKSAG